MASACSNTPIRQPVRIGHIGLQSREGPVAFRNIRLRPLGLKPLFNGRDLDGWNTERAEKCKFDVTEDGELHVTNGPGQIETNDEFANFVLQLECKVNGDGLNSGIFFRTLREGRWAGYESQINNVFKDGDRDEAGRFRHGRHLSPAAGAARRGRRSRVVHEDDRRRRAAHGRVGERVPGERLDRRRGRRRRMPAKGVATGAGRDRDSGARSDDGFSVSQYPRGGAAAVRVAGCGSRSRSAVGVDILRCACHAVRRRTTMVGLRLSSNRDCTVR